VSRANGLMGVLEKMLDKVYYIKGKEKHIWADPISSEFLDAASEGTFKAIRFVANSKDKSLHIWHYLGFHETIWNILTGKKLDYDDKSLLNGVMLKEGGKWVVTAVSELSWYRSNIDELIKSNKFNFLKDKYKIEFDFDQIKVS